MQYEITRRQSTFWDFTGPEGSTRVHFIEKKEFGFTETSVPEIRFEDSHPLLVDYSSAWTQTFVSSPAAQPIALSERIDQSIKAMSRQWRSLATYRDMTVLLEVLASGYGAIGALPVPIASAVSALLTEEGIRFTTLPGHGPRGHYRALIAGRN